MKIRVVAGNLKELKHRLSHSLNVRLYGMQSHSKQATDRVIQVGLIPLDVIY